MIRHLARTPDPRVQVRARQPCRSRRPAHRREPLPRGARAPSQARTLGPSSARDVTRGCTGPLPQGVVRAASRLRASRATMAPTAGPGDTPLVASPIVPSVTGLTVGFVVNDRAAPAVSVIETSPKRSWAQSRLGDRCDRQPGRPPADECSSAGAPTSHARNCPTPVARSRLDDIDVVTASRGERRLDRWRAHDRKRGQAGVSRLARNRLRFVLPHKLGDDLGAASRRVTARNREPRPRGVLPQGSVSLARFPPQTRGRGHRVRPDGLGNGGL
jgi:hypothetical protein